MKKMLAALMTCSFLLVAWSPAALAHHDRDRHDHDYYYRHHRHHHHHHYYRHGYHHHDGALTIATHVGNTDVIWTVP